MAHFPARNVDQVGHHGAGRRPIARTGALEQQATREVAFRHNRIGRAIDMGQRVIDRHQMRLNPLE